MRHLSKDVDTSGTVAVAQTSARNGNEIHDGIELIQQFGLVSVPPLGSYAATLASSGLNDNAFIIGTHNPKHYPKGLKAGETMIHDMGGQSVYLKADGTIIVNSTKTVNVTINGSAVMTVEKGKVSITGDLDVSGTVTGSTDVVGGGKSLKSHVHTSGKQGSPTSSPN